MKLIVATSPFQLFLALSLVNDSCEYRLLTTAKLYTLFKKCIDDKHVQVVKICSFARGDDYFYRLFAYIANVIKYAHHMLLAESVYLSSVLKFDQRVIFYLARVLGVKFCIYEDGAGSYVNPNIIVSRLSQFWGNRLEVEQRIVESHYLFPTYASLQARVNSEISVADFKYHVESLKSRLDLGCLKMHREKKVASKVYVFLVPSLLNTDCAQIKQLFDRVLIEAVANDWHLYVKLHPSLDNKVSPFRANICYPLETLFQRSDLPVEVIMSIVCEVYDSDVFLIGTLSTAMYTVKIVAPEVKSFVLSDMSQRHQNLDSLYRLLGVTVIRNSGGLPREVEEVLF